MSCMLGTLKREGRKGGNYTANVTTGARRREIYEVGRRGQGVRIQGVK